jgi:hypothetical protein
VFIIGTPMIPTSISILGVITTTFGNGLYGQGEKLLAMRPLEMLESLKVVVSILPPKNAALVCLIKYNNFVIIINDKRLMEQYFKKVESFLVEHGLQLSSEKTCIFLWKIGKRFHFIGFIFHKINRAWFHS